MRARHATVINLAAALVRSGKDVLVIDENAGANNLGGTLGINAHRDLLDVVRRDKTLDEVIIPAPKGSASCRQGAACACSKI